MTDDDPLVKHYSGWRLVLAGVAVVVVGVVSLMVISAADIQLGNGRASSLVVLTVPIGVVLIIVGLVSVVRRKPVTDDTAKHDDFRRRNRELMKQQRDDRRAKRRQP